MWRRTASLAWAAPEEMDALLRSGAVALDIRDKEEHDAGHLGVFLHISRGKLGMNVAGGVARSRPDDPVLLQRL